MELNKTEFPNKDSLVDIVVTDKQGQSRVQQFVYTL